MARAFRTLAILGAVALAAGCSVKDTTTPDLTGPSELALSLSVSATPDTISQDGTAQTQVVVIARDAAGKAVAGLPVRFDVTRNGQIVDYGVLSAKTVVTGSDGRASVVYTAPAPPANSSDVGTTTVSVLATPIGTNYANIVPRTVDIRLVPPGSVPPTGLGPVATFSYSWSGTPGAGVPVVFNAAASSSPAGLVSYAWDFGDGTTGGNGVTVQHTFSVAGTYAVRLTVTDKKGQIAWMTQQVTVAAGPTALFTWAPASPTSGAIVTFNAALSWAVPPATIATYAWDFGDPQPGSPVIGGVTAFHAFGAAGTYTVRLVVTDSNGLVGQLTQTVTVQ
jgi:PKD repeat protein